jgi:thiamine-phosphate pyrophosphorylase
MTYLGGLCFITDRRVSELAYEDMTRKVLMKGIRWIQFRDKETSRREIYRNASRLRRLARDYDAVFIVNDFPDVAMCTDADGVHLGQDDLPLKEARKIIGRDRIIGISTHSLEQAVEAERDGADYIGFGPVFATLTKDAGLPKGIAMLREIRKRVKIPVVAIGGISLKNIGSVLQTGVDAIAVSSAILKGDIEENAGHFMDCFRISNHYPDSQRK